MANGTSALVGVLQPKRVCLAAYKIWWPEMKVRAELDRSSWLGEIKCRIKLRAKPKYEIFPFSTKLSVSQIPFFHGQRVMTKLQMAAVNVHKK